MQRRDFLKKSGLFTAGAYGLSQSDLLAFSLQKKISPFGVQLYSVRDELPKDPKGIMKSLAEMGYKQFESYQGEMGFLWGMEPKEIKSFLGDLGVKMVSTHFDFINAAKDPDLLKKSIEMAEGAGLKYLLCPYIGPQDSWDAWKKVAEQFNKVGEEVSRAGLQFGYHNHDYSFKILEGKMPQEFLIENTDPKNVIFELDLCWIDVAGVDTAAHLDKYGKYYQLCHIKDYVIEDGKPKQVDLGKGDVDIQQTLQTVMKSGIKYFIVEQEEYPKSPLASLEYDAGYMKNLKV